MLSASANAARGLSRVGAQFYRDLVSIWFGFEGSFLTALQTTIPTPPVMQTIARHVPTRTITQVAKKSKTVKVVLRQMASRRTLGGR